MQWTIVDGFWYVLSEGKFCLDLDAVKVWDWMYTEPESEA